MNPKECFIGNNECSSTIIKAHILSQKATMNLIHGPDDKGQQKVILIGHKMNNTWIPKPTGWKLASTHKCFCGHHDSSLFDKIENNNLFDINNKEHLFLQSMRSFAFSYHKKRKEILKNVTEFNTISDTINSLTEFKDNLMNLLSFEDSEKQSFKSSSSEEFISPYFYSFEETRKDILYISETKSYEKMVYVKYVKKMKFPFASAGVLTAEIMDNFGYNSSVVIYNSNQPVVRKPSIILTVMPTKRNETIILLSALKDDENGVLNLKRFSDLKNNEEFERAITGLMLTSNKENTFLNPLFWEYLKTNKLDKIIHNEINRERGLDLHLSKPHLSKLNFFSKEFTIKNLNI